jgi:hypothetical protein
MPSWAAARCTSAATPHFSAFQWQGQALLDGCFRSSCPAKLGLEEANDIWPEKRCDVLVSLGTGKSASQNESSSTRDVLSASGKTVDIVSSAEDLWNQALAHAENDTTLKERLFRLNPIYQGDGFVYDDHEKLGRIAAQAKQWLDTPYAHGQLANVSGRLISALFFFVLAGRIDNGTQRGQILCRLPTDLSERCRLVGAMRHLPASRLFRVTHVDNPREPEFADARESLLDLLPGFELRVPVTIEGLPDVGRVDIEIEMLNVCQRSTMETEMWSPISASPYTLREGI